MILAIDIGNTRTTFAVLHNGAIVREQHLPTSRLIYRRAVDAVRTVCKSGETETITAAGIASVVPHLVELTRNAVIEITQFDPALITAETAGISTSYGAPLTIGADRICNCIAANALVGGAAIIIDCGTAVTLDCIDQGGSFLGGAILAGYRSASRALTSATALLPEIELTVPERAMGTTTDECLRSGIILGTSFAIDGLIDRLITESYHGSKPILIATGGHSALFAATSKHSLREMPDLVLQGIETVLTRVT